MATITRRDGKRGPTWQVRYTQANGERGFKAFKVERDAVDYAAVVTVDVLRGVRRARHDVGRVTVGDWADECLTEHWRDNSRGTLDRYRHTIDARVRQRFGDWPLVNVTADDLRAWLVYLRDVEGLAYATIRVEYAPLRKLFRTAVALGRLEHSPTEGVTITRPAKASAVDADDLDDDEPVFLTYDEVDMLAEAIDERYRAFVFLGAYCGLRPGELFALRVGDLELERIDLDGDASPALNVRNTVAGTGTGKAYINAVKTRAGRRQVPIPTGLVLDELLAHLDRRFDGVARPGAHVFTRANGVYLNGSTFRGPFRAAIAAVEGVPATRLDGLTAEARTLPVGLTPHKLRHTAVRFWIDTGADALEVKTWAGHASVAFTYDVYGGLFPSHGRTVARRLDERARAARNSRVTGHTTRRHRRLAGHLGVAS